MGNKNFNFLYNKRRNTLKVKFQERPVNPQTTQFNIKVTIDGTNFPTVPASVTPDTNGNCNLTLDIANQELGIWEVEAVPVRNGLEVRDDTIYGEYNTVNLFARRNAIIAYVILALLAICFGAYKWMSRDTSVKKIAQIEIPNGRNDRNSSSPAPAPLETGTDDDHDNSPSSGNDSGKAFTKTKTGYVVVPVYIPARTQYTRIALRDNNPSGGIEWDDNTTGVNPGAPLPKVKKNGARLQPSNAQTPVRQNADITVHTQEVEGITLSPGASYTQATVPGRVLKPVASVPSAIQTTHTGGQRIDPLKSTTADTVTIRNISDAPVYVQFQWSEIIDNEPAEK